MKRKVSVYEVKVPARRGGKAFAARVALAKPVVRPIQDASLDTAPAREIPRVKIRTPITPKAVRDQLLAVVADLPATVRAEFVASRLTPLDRFLTDDQAVALETFAADEANLERMNIGAFGSDRVQSSSTQHDTMSSLRLKALARHQKLKRAFNADELTGLRIWCEQMSAQRMAPSFALAAVAIGLVLPWDTQMCRHDQRWHIEGATQAWFGFLAAIGDKLHRLYQARSLGNFRS